MGLTVHYDLRLKTISTTRACITVRELYRRVKELPVTVLIEPVYRQWTYAGTVPGQMPSISRDDPVYPLVVAAMQYRALPCVDQPGTRLHIEVPPLEMIAFAVDIGEGCEAMRLGLACYPKFVIAQRPSVQGRRIRTRLASDWRWSSFCKTQYASNPDCGGIPNFLRCHKLVIAILDICRDLGMLVDVYDEGEFWEHRDEQRLAQIVSQWNVGIAMFADALKRACLPNADIDAPISEFPDFHELVQQGRNRQ